MKRNSSYLECCLSILAVVFMMVTACSKYVHSNEDQSIEYSDTEIIPTASIVSASITKADFEGPVNGTSFTPNTSKIFGVTAFISDDIPMSYSPNSLLNNEAVHSDENGNYLFDEVRYFPRSKKTFFYAYSPMVHCTYTDGEGGFPPTVTYDLTGREDILWSKNDSGLTGIPESEQESIKQPDFKFEHKLQRIAFRVKRTANIPSNYSISEIRITDIKTTAILNIIDGTLRLEENQNKTYVSITYNHTLTTSFVDIPYDLMIGVPENGQKNIIKVSFQIGGLFFNGEAEISETRPGYKHIIEVTFDGGNLILQAPVVVEWDEYSTSGKI